MVAKRSAITATVASSAAPGCVRPSHLIVFTGQWWTVPWYVRILRITQGRVLEAVPGSTPGCDGRIRAPDPDGWPLAVSRPPAQISYERHVRHWSGLEQRTSRWTTWTKIAVAGLARTLALTGDRDLVLAPW